MLAPSFDAVPNEDKDIVKNKKAKPVRIARKNGKLVLLAGSEKVAGKNMIVDRLNEMKMEVQHAQAGRTESVMKDLGGSKGYEFKRHGIKSTFPSWFSKLGFKSKSDFMSVLNRRKGVRYDRLADKAVNDLSNGYNTSFGRVPANLEFQVKTKQKFDNRGVIFRVIDGKVRPIRPGAVPF